MNPSEKILFGCVAENNHKFLSQALRLVRSVRWFGGTLKDVDIVVCVVDEIDPRYERVLDLLGARIRIVSRFDPANPLFNKIEAFRVPDLDQYDILLFLDCDTVVVQDPAPFLNSEFLQVKVADVPTVPSDLLVDLCTRFGLTSTERSYVTTLDPTPTVWYCNAGIISCPVKYLQCLVPRWCEYELKFSADPSLLGPYQKHRSQAALALAHASERVPYREFPVSMNFPLHLTHLPSTPEVLEADPIILHYHDLIDSSGFLKPSPYPLAQKRIEQFNERLRTSSSPDVIVRRRRLSPETRAAGDSLAVCIAGMHRSGTSMVARMLHECGVNIGPEADLSKPGDDNEEGFWENPEFVAFNEELLNELGGRWDRPPEIPLSFENNGLDALRQKASQLVKKYKDDVWGWKDPRNSLTVPFWRELVPGMKVVVCLRNPQEVMQSLIKRGSAGEKTQLDLWRTYYRSLMTAVPQTSRLITHYSRYFENPQQELGRVLAFLGLNVPAGLVKRACSVVSGRLRHNEATTEDLIDSGLPDEVLEEYLALCAEAELTGDAPFENGGQLSEADREIRLLRSTLFSRDVDLEWFRNEVAIQEQELARLKGVIEIRDRDLDWLKNEVAIRDRAFTLLKDEAASLREKVSSLQETIRSLQESIRSRTVLSSIKDALIRNKGQTNSE